MARDIICTIDWQGGKQIKKIMQNAVLILLLPPSINELSNRLISRNTDSLHEIKKRVDHAKYEIIKSKESGYLELGYVVINNVFDQTVNEVLNIINIERNNRWDKTKLDSFIQSI